MGLPLVAVVMYLEAIEISKDGSSDHAVSPMLLLNYARVVRDLGRLEEAAELAERAYDKAQASHLEVVVNQSLILRGSIYRERKQLQPAIEMLVELEPRLRKALPVGHMAFASLAIEKGLNAQASGDLVRARQLLNQAKEIIEASVAAGRQGADFVPTLLLRSSSLAVQEQRADAAVADAERALMLLKVANPSQRASSLLGRAYFAVGQALKAQGKVSEARSAMQLAAKHFETALGPKHADTLAARIF
jgi:tetratricopeptide (TPR) repeat protein